MEAARDCTILENILDACRTNRCQLGYRKLCVECPNAALKLVARTRPTTDLLDRVIQAIPTQYPPLLR